MWNGSLCYAQPSRRRLFHDTSKFCIHTSKELLSDISSHLTELYGLQHPQESIARGSGVSVESAVRRFVGSERSCIVYPLT